MTVPTKDSILATLGTMSEGDVIEARTLFGSMDSNQSLAWRLEKATNEKYVLQSYYRDIKAVSVTINRPLKEATPDVDS